jgi:hypothetical protein
MDAAEKIDHTEETKRLDDECRMHGEFTIEVLRAGKDGVVRCIDKRVVPNLIVNTGKRQVWRQASGSLNAKQFNFMRIGTSSQAATSAQTNLTSVITGTLKTLNQVTLLSGTRTIQYMYSYPSGAGTKSATKIQEVCILNQHTSPGGSALNRSTFTAVNKTTADKLKITYRARIT